MSGSNITALHQGVVTFCNSPSAAGIGVTGNHFAIGGFNETCDADIYGTPAVPWGVLPFPAFTSWVSGLPADGYSPFVPALTGAVTACKSRVQAQPTHKCVVVLVSDGQPEGNCPPNGQAAQAPLGQIAAQSCAAGSPVFAIGFPGLSALGQNIINAVAQQGCTGQAFIIQGGNIGQQFLDELKKIQQASVGCVFLMPTTDAGLVDKNKVTIKYTPDGGTEQIIPHVDDQSKCGGGDGWYYDNNTNPTKLALCPARCTTVKNDQGAKINVSAECLAS
jgi:hypothetical protein